jgi:OOP family OmpA-OmpF porin
MFIQDINKLRHILLVGIFSISSIAISSIAQAEGWYAGVGFGQSKVKEDLGCSELVGFGVTCSSDDTDTGWKVFIGNQFTKNAAVEFGYLDLGQSKVSVTDGVDTVNVQWEAKGFDVALLGILPVDDKFNFFGRIGMFRWDLDAKLSGTLGSASTSENGVDLTYGIGATWDFGKTTSLRFGWDRFNDVGDEDETGESDVDLLSASLVFRFK